MLLHHNGDVADVRHVAGVHQLDTTSATNPGLKAKAVAGGCHSPLHPSDHVVPLWMCSAASVEGQVVHCIAATLGEDELLSVVASAGASIGQGGSAMWLLRACGRPSRQKRTYESWRLTTRCTIGTK